MNRYHDPNHERPVRQDGYMYTDGRLFLPSMNHVRVIRDSDPNHGVAKSSVEPIAKIEDSATTTARKAGTSATKVKKIRAVKKKKKAINDIPAK